MSDRHQSNGAWSYQCALCYADYKPDELPADGRCKKCDESPKLTAKQSEFGAGIVVCIAKFSEHLGNEEEGMAHQLIRHREKGHELGADAQRELDFQTRFQRENPRYAGQNPVDKAIESAIARWAMGASDHLSEVDAAAPERLLALVGAVFTCRNTHMGDVSIEQVITAFSSVRTLWREACLDVDRMLGVNPNWGEW